MVILCDTDLEKALHIRSPMVLVLNMIFIQLVVCFLSPDLGGY